jgi:hypothetical protein
MSTIITWLSIHSHWLVIFIVGFLIGAYLHDNRKDK